MKTAPILILALCAAAPALAAPADKFLGRFGAWEASRTAVSGDTVCFAAAQPTKRDGKLPVRERDAKRADPSFLIAHWTKRKAFGQLQIKAGFALLADSKAELTVGEKTFKLFVKGDSAWAEDAKTDAAILAALKAGKTATLAATLAANKARIVDTYSLAGLAKALEAIDKACDRKPAAKPGA